METASTDRGGRRRYIGSITYAAGQMVICYSPRRRETLAGNWGILGEDKGRVEGNHESEFRSVESE